MENPDENMGKSIAFGPVPSRRLGRSVGINNIPPKICTFSCVYCQLGRTLKMQVERQGFYQPEEVLRAVSRKLEEAKVAEEKVNYLTFVPDGEPTLDTNLGEEILLLKTLGVPIAVITNSSLIFQKEVREALREADWVSLKVDAANEKVWKMVDRPHGSLNLSAILEGILEFAKDFEGELMTETMLVSGLNDSDSVLKETAEFIGRLLPNKAYISIPTRPPAEKWVKSPDEHGVNNAYQIFSEKVGKVEYLTGYEGNEFALTGDIERDILSITAVHPMREDAVEAFLDRAKAGWNTVRRMVDQKMIIESEYGAKKFYVRRFKRS